MKSILQILEILVSSQPALKIAGSSEETPQLKELVFNKEELQALYKIAKIHETSVLNFLTWVVKDDMTELKKAIQLELGEVFNTTIEK